MKPRHHAALLLFLLLLAGIATWWWPSRDQPAPTVASPAPIPDKRTGSPRHPPTATAPAATVIENSALATLITGHLLNGTTDEHDHALHTLLPRMIALDPAAAARLALDWAPGLRRTELLGAVARHWAEADLAAALAWLITLPDAADRRVASDATTAWLAQGDPAGALEFGQWLGAGTDDGRLEHILQIWTEENPDEAVEWVTRQPAQPQRDLLLARVVHVRAQQSPLTAARLALDHLPPGHGQDEALVSVVRHWAARDVEAAAAWVAEFPAGPLQARAQAEISRARRLR